MSRRRRPSGIVWDRVVSHGDTIGHHGLDVQLVQDAIEILVARIRAASSAFFATSHFICSGVLSE